jgi:DNA-binding FadR family transcriptional regulator
LKCAAPGVADLPLAGIAAAGKTHPCGTSASTAALIEGFYRRVVAVSQNEAMMSVLENFIDRTHYVRTLDLQTPERADEITDRFRALAQSLRREDTNEALTHLERLLERKLEMKLSLPIRNLRATRAEASALDPLASYREWEG